MLHYQRKITPLSVSVGGAVVDGGLGMDLLGVKLGKRLGFTSHLSNLVTDAKRSAHMVNRLACHLPPGPYLRQLINGKILYAAAAVGHGRLHSDDAPSDAGLHKAIQVAINTAARSVVGLKSKDRVRTELILKKAGLPSYNRAVVRLVAVEAWKTLYGNNMPAGRLINRVDNGTRAGTAGHFAAPSRLPTRTFVWDAVKILNLCPTLVQAKTLKAAKTLSRSFSMNTPL